MNAWLVPIKPQSWRVVKSSGIFGLPKMEQRVRIGDFIIFYVLKSASGIVALGKIVSNAFEDHADLWGKNKYPFRFRVEIIFDCSEFGGKAVPLSVVYGKTSSPNVSIEPFFHNVWITKISDQQYEKLKRYLLSINCRT